MSSSILIVDDSATIRAGLAAAVRKMKLEPALAESGEKALEMFCAEVPGVVLLDVNMGGIDGYETARRMRAARADVWVPIIFLSSNEYDHDLERAIECGGDDYLVKPVSAVVLSAKIRALQRLDKMHQRVLELSKDLAAANQRLETVAQQDGLTGVANRRAFDHRLPLTMAHAARQKEALCVVLCDVDHFKAYNDHYGHPAGDECLKQVSAALAQGCKRATDLVARYGGEEFALLLPATPVEGALKVVETVRLELARRAVPHAASQSAAVVTFSAGLASYDPERDREPQQLIKRADEALYRAKDLGRNRTVAAA